MDAIELLLADHRKVDGIFQQFEKGGNSDEFTRLFAQLKDELTVHSQIEEEIFYPAARENSNTANLVAEAYQEQAEVKQLLSQVESLDNTTTEWGQQMTEIMRDVQAHVQMEETEMFPRMREHFDAAALADLGQRMEQRKAELKGQTGATVAPEARTDYSAQPGSMAQSDYSTQSGTMAQPGNMTRPDYTAQPDYSTQSGNRAQSDSTARPDYKAPRGTNNPASQDQLGAMDETRDFNQPSM